jgi:hypothetical protein
MTEISLHILDIFQNALTAGAASITIIVEEDWGKDMLLIRIRDNGKGMDPDILERTVDPFFTSRNTRKVGMGIPLLRQHSEMAGGRTIIESSTGRGTDVIATFRLGHPDRQPLGDLAGSMVMMMAANPTVEIVLKYQTPTGSFSISHSEIKSMFSIDRITDKTLRDQLISLIINNLEVLEFKA